MHLILQARKRPGIAVGVELIVKFEPNTEGELAEKSEQLTKFVRGNLKAMKRALGVEARA